MAKCKLTGNDCDHPVCATPKLTAGMDHVCCGVGCKVSGCENGKPPKLTAAQRDLLTELKVCADMPQYSDGVSVHGRGANASLDVLARLGLVEVVAGYEGRFNGRIAKLTPAGRAAVEGERQAVDCDTKGKRP